MLTRFMTENSNEMRIKFVFRSAVAQLCNSGDVTDSQVLEKLEGLSTQADPLK